MDTRTYTFTLPNYSLLSDEELLATVTNHLDRIKKEMQMPAGILSRTKNFAILFTRLSFLTQEMERRRPGVIAKIDEDLEIDRMLKDLNIETND